MRTILRTIAGFIVAALVATGMLVSTTAPAHADFYTEECVWEGGEYKDAKFCFRIRGDRTVTPNIQGDYVVKKTKLYMTSPYSDSTLGYVDMYNIDLRVRETRLGDPVKEVYNGSTNTREWILRGDYRCPNGCTFSVDFTIGWTSLIGWPDDRRHIDFSQG